MTADKVARVRELNDALRIRGIGGQIVLTAGVVALGEVAVASIFRALKTFDQFDEDNDPYGEHDFAALRVGDIRVVYKIDYYNLTMDGLSPAPSDPALTIRVMTVLLPEEY
jgi:hypothetical protein